MRLITLIVITKDGSKYSAQRIVGIGTGELDDNAI